MPERRKMIEILDKNMLYKATGWFSVDCERLVEALDKCGLVIVPRDQVDEHNQFCNLVEDDLR